MKSHLKGLLSPSGKLVLGLMSGTSADGLDLALCRISRNRQNFSVKVLQTGFARYPQKLHESIIKIASRTVISKGELVSMDKELADFYVAAITKFTRVHKIGRIDLIGSHGQTIYHADRRLAPSAKLGQGTWQIVNGGRIAAGTGIPVISNFRVNDTALGGVGAPLMPICHFYLFAQKHRNIAILNLGGISNLTYLPGKCREDLIRASDCGPGNMLSDRLVGRLYGRRFDLGGKIALSGQISPTLINSLLQTAWFRKLFPKSLGREQFGEIMIDNIIRAGKKLGLSDQDMVCTVAELTIKGVQKYLTQHACPQTFIICGGGVHNRYFGRRLRECLPDSEVVSSAEYGIDPDYVEAAGFALLAYMFIAERPANLTAVTGAKRQTILGELALP